MEENKSHKGIKLKIILLTILCFLFTAIGVTYAYFTIQVSGNNTASSMTVTTALLSLVYNDVQIMSGSEVYPGWHQTKTLTVYNNGTDTVNYIIVWRDLLNQITNNELVISATCSSNVQGNTCSNISETIVPTASSQISNVYVKGPVSIEAGEIHTYTVTAEFKELGSNQNYNQNKEFYGTLNIAEWRPTDEECFTTTGTTTLSIRKYTCDDPDVIIPSTIDGIPVTGIINGAFMKKNLTSVVIPDSITTLGASVFYDNQLTSVIIPNSVTTIDQSAFRNNQLTSVTIPNTVTSIGSVAFSSNQLTSVTIPNSITTLTTAFSHNPLTSVTIPNNVTTIGDDAFNSCQLTSVKISNGVTTIGEEAFYNNQLTSVIIPNSVTTIGDRAFYTNSLTSCILGTSVSSIGEGAFHTNQLSTLTIPPSVMSIGYLAFSMNQLTSVIIEGKSSPSDFTTIEGAFDDTSWAIYGAFNIIYTGSGS